MHVGVRVCALRERAVQVRTERWRRNASGALPVIVNRAMEELRGFAESNQVLLRAAEDLPAVDVPAAVVQRALSNLISNGVK